MAEAKLPTEEEIATLPRWARVAFAARCARRAQPFFLKAWPKAPHKHLKSIEGAISLAEAAAGVAGADAADAADADAAAADAAYAAYSAAKTADDAANAASAAAHAAHANAANANAAFAAAAAAAFAANANTAAGGDGDAIAQDFKLLLTKAITEKWTDNTPVPPSVFPPIPELPNLPKAKAEDYIDPFIEPNNAVETELKLKAYIRDGVDSDVARQKLRALYNSLNDLSIANFGKGLSIKDFRQYIVAEVPAEVLS